LRQLVKKLEIFSLALDISTVNPENSAGLFGRAA
jgi:hypothetical protein